MLKILFLNFVNFLTKVPEFWLILDRSHRTLIWKVRMIRSLADRTFQFRSATPTTAPSMSPTPQPTRRTLCWEVRYRSSLWFFSQMNKLYRARSPLYRRQSLQENIHWEALDEIYKIYMLLHRSDLNISSEIPWCFADFSGNLILQNFEFRIFRSNYLSHRF